LTEVENAHAVGSSLPVKRTAGCAVPLESVTTTLVDANVAPVGVATLGPLAIATITGTRLADMGNSLNSVAEYEKAKHTLNA
jgi:hypothetical protein